MLLKLSSRALQLHSRFFILAFVVTHSGCVSSPQPTRTPYGFQGDASVQFLKEGGLVDGVSNKDFFTRGSTFDEVAVVMGTPTSISEFGSETWWYYGYSKVVFFNGRVSSWNDRDSRLKVRWTSSATGKSVASATQPQSPNVTASEIDARVNSILAGRYSPLPPAQRVQSNPTARFADVETRNNTNYTLTILYSGPSSQQMVLPGNSSKSVRLVPGKYRVAATANLPTVTPFAGEDEMVGGAYSSVFYIKSRRIPEAQ